MKTEILSDKNESDIKRAAGLIKAGGIVAFATETVYGLGADASNPEAVEKIFSAKGRPQDNPLIVHLSSADDTGIYAEPNGLFRKLSDRFMPGPLTVILPRKQTVCDKVTCGLDTVGIRVPLYLPARKLIEYSGCPIAAPSANISGKPSPTKADHVINDMNGKVDCILCGDDCSVGVESTVVKIAGPDSLIVCRPGGITVEMLESVCGSVETDPAVMSAFSGKPISPGMKYKHYSPTAEVIILDGTEEQIADYLDGKKDFAVICFDEDGLLKKYDDVYILGKRDDAGEQAERIFDALRTMDKKPWIKTVYARMPQTGGVGLAVYNRLIKAAAFRTVTL